MRKLVCQFQFELGWQENLQGMDLSCIGLSNNDLQRSIRGNQESISSFWSENLMWDCRLLRVEELGYVKIECIIVFTV